jgi:hypothetical protein
VNRLFLLVVGFFLLLAALFLLWWLSPASQGFQQEMGIAPAGLRPKDLPLVLHTLFGLGLILVGGYFMQSFAWALAGVMTGAREPTREAIAPMVIWGVVFYVLISALFGIMIVLLVHGSSEFGLFFDPAFLVALLTWPYQLVAALGAFGFPPEAYH